MNEKKVTINTDHLLQCIKTLEFSLERLLASKEKSIDYKVFRNAVIKGFELTLETAGKLLRKKLKTYAASSRAIDELSYKDLFREAVKHGLLTTETVARWFAYRDNRTDTAHDYGIHFANETLKLLSQFVLDAKALEKVVK
jgi:nucleotidyltransferase substrate binding protein (TIGR01987 family)